MRWLFGLLLLLNIGLFMWASWFQTSSPSAMPQSRPPVNADKLRPLSQTRASAAVAASVSCASLGPFRNPAQAEAAAGVLARQGVTGWRRQQEERAPSYRVYIPSLASREAAERRRAQLARLGFKDHYVIDEAGRENAISLGVFAVEQNAVALKERLATKTIDAEVEALDSVQTTHWVDVELSTEELERLGKTSFDPAGVARLTERPCPERG